MVIGTYKFTWFTFLRHPFVDQSDRKDEQLGKLFPDYPGWDVNQNP